MVSAECGMDTVDGSDWSVLPNWEATKGIVNNVLIISYVPPHIHPLETQFSGDFFFEPTPTQPQCRINTRSTKESNTPSHGLHNNRRHTVESQLKSQRPGHKNKMHSDYARICQGPRNTHFKRMLWTRTHPTTPMGLILLARHANRL